MVGITWRGSLVRLGPGHSEVDSTKTFPLLSITFQTRICMVQMGVTVDGIQMAGERSIDTQLNEKLKKSQGRPGSKKSTPFRTLVCISTLVNNIIFKISVKFN